MIIIFLIYNFQVSHLSHSHGKNHKGLVHMLPHLPHPFIFIPRYSPCLCLYYLYSLKAAYTNDLCLRNTRWGCVCVYVDMDLEDELGCAERKRKEGEGISLPPFGLATYKMQGNVWVSGNCGRDQERLVSLLSVADSWLKQLRVQHHDFNYFSGIRRG